jgi:hypothetical protein
VERALPGLKDDIVRIWVLSASIREIDNSTKFARKGGQTIACLGYEMDCPKGTQCSCPNGVYKFDRMAGFGNAYIH